ncbi:unnamed protein product [Acanthoscelides obtectus]|nr:unnamed protein product [Acanthoscelides obtectus]CAK1689260.1 hypothetical protein AOBTE_LOCUS37126 [Acanthoscelides obtectus]
MKRVGKSLVTKAAKEQLRSWPSDWSMTVNMEELLEDLEDDEEEPEIADGTEARSE